MFDALALEKYTWGMKKKASVKELEKVVTLDVLLEYTDTLLLPRIGDMMNEMEGRIKYELKSYMDDKFADQTSDIFSRLDKREGAHRTFKHKIVDIFKASNIGSPEDRAYLEGLAQV